MYMHTYDGYFKQFQIMQIIGQQQEQKKKKKNKTTKLFKLFTSCGHNDNNDDNDDDDYVDDDRCIVVVQRVRRDAKVYKCGLFLFANDLESFTYECSCVCLFMYVCKKLLRCKM